ncbi:hypothetical protein [Streptomyces chattanoogensis]|uniref:Lipoprotein n=1 Tax=Streptomyces chattanoogensis TaxID=66876 RepID=A0A0N0XSC9_9ACTN|nr:hypothetical protein [Streptomyces chattanoogensis]KPC60736.1 lipoprotein [Streptomyces chattanoogensis]
MARRSSLALSRSSVRTVGAVLAGAMLCGTAACSSPGGAGRDRTAKPEKFNAAPVAAVQKAVDKGARLNSLSYRINGKVGGQGTVEGKVSFSLRPRAIDMRMKASGGLKSGEFSVRLIGDTVYVGAGERAAAALHGKHWLKFQMRGKGAGGAGGFGGMRQQADQDPAAQASLLAQSGDVKKVGVETVDGVRTTHYAGTVSVDELLKRRHAKGALGAERRAKAVRRYKQLGVNALKLDLWVGPDDRTVKFRERAGTDRGPLDLTIRFFDVNKPVTVQAPPASDTVDLAEHFKQQFQQGFGKRFEEREGTRI